MYKQRRNNQVQNSNKIIQKNENFYKNSSFIDDEKNDVPLYVYDYFRATSAQSAELKLNQDQIKAQKSNE
jgi:hypothetical protein